MSSHAAEQLSELELDALWTIYEGHSLIIEYPEGAGKEPYSHAIMAVAYEDGEAVAEVAEIPLETSRALVERGFLQLSEDGPVLDENSWFDEELECNVRAEEYVLSEQGNGVIEATADEDEDEDDDYDDDYDEDDEDEGFDDDEDDEDDLGDEDDEDEDDEDEEE